MDCDGFWSDVTEHVWTMALEYWLSAFTKWITVLFNWIFGLNDGGHGIVP